MSSAADKLAVLVPVFNGGELLRETVLSCAQAGLEPEQYEIIVVDNCSGDGVPGRLPSHDPNGATVQVHRNPSNIGRIGNWNRSVAIAMQQGFRYITFLFVGDAWIPNGSLPELLTVVREHDAAIGLSPFKICNAHGQPRRASQRFYVSGGRSVVTNSRCFLSTLLESGMFPLGPLQANIYRVSPSHPLHFDEKLPTRTDVETTLAFIGQSQGNVAIVAKSFFQWREHQNRFHMSMGTGQTIRDYLATFHAACEQTGITVDYRRAKARLLLNAARLIVHDAPLSQWAPLGAALLRHSRRSPYRSSFYALCETLWLRFALRRRLLEFS